jgi:hypothetical protein
MSFQTVQNDEHNGGQESKKALESALRKIWLPLHNSISNLSLECHVDGNYLRDLAKRLGLRRTLLASTTV